MAWFTRDELPYDLTTLREMLTVMPRPRKTRALETDEFGEDHWVTRTEEASDPIPCWRMRERTGLPSEVGVPIDWAMENIHGFATNHSNKTERGSTIEVARLPDPHHPSAPPGQAEFFQDVEDQTREHYTCFAQAPTGSGKTVTALNAVGKARRTALFIVPNTTLADQWVKEARKHLGIDPKRIGRMGGGGNRWKDCDLVVGVINTIAMIPQPAAFYRHFGFVVWDEAHRLGAQEFSKSMAMFPARYKLALTATPDRKDGMDEVFFNYFGKPAAVAKAQALSTTCYRVPFPIIGRTDWIDRCRNDVRPMKWLAGLVKRNEMLVKLIRRNYDAGRSIIVMGKFIDQLETLFDLCVQAGIPREVMAPYTGSWKGKKLGQGYLNKVKAEATIQFATYSKAKEGYDCPRLDCGIEATPVSDNVQGIGRVRRPFKGKKKPIWFTVDDLNVSVFQRYSKSRLRGFENANVTIKDYHEK
jgi:superfamily II DNA or RNA helicase